MKSTDILGTIKKNCCEHENEESYFDVLQKIYNHLEVHENEALPSRVKSIKKIFDSNYKIGDD